MLQYILEVTLCWGLFYTIFYGFLRKLTFFSVNRWYLLGTLIMGILIPLLRHIELDFYQDEIAQSIPVAIAVKELPAQVAITVEEATIEWSSIIYNVLRTLYLIGVSFFGARMIRSIYRIYGLYRDGQHEDRGNASIIYTDADHLPFSFFRYVYISRQVDLTDNFEEVLQHEIAHVRSYHSIDVLLMELIQIAFWFNPMIYIYKTALRQTHEYLADEAVLQHTNRKTYGTMLLKQSLSGLEIALTHRFFHSHIKKRINMMYQKKSGRSAWLKYALALPVLFVLTVVFANHSRINGTHKESQHSTNPYTCESSDIQVFTEVDQEPYFSEYDRTLTTVDEIHKSAFNNLNQYLYNHISSDPELHNKVKGKWVEVNMTVTKYGKINDLTIPMGVDQQADQKLLDLFIDLNKKDMPFIPAIKDGETVSAIMTIPFMFVEDGQGLIHLPLKRFKKDRLKKELNDVIQTIGQDRRKITPSIEKITKKYLTKFPNEHRDVISTLTVWGWENGYRIQPISESIIIKGYSQKGNYPIGDVESLTLDISTMNRDNLKFSHTGFEDFSSITKDNIKELIHIIYDNSPSSSQCLKDFLKFSYPHRDRNDLQEIIIERFKEVLDNEDITVYQDFEKLELSINTNLPDELISLANYSIDEEIMPIIWTQEFDNSQLLEEFIDFDKPIKAIYHLPAEEATKIFGERGNKGFYALLGYERPRTHPIKQKKMLEYELDNFYTTLKQTNERGWVTKLKEVHKQLQEKYPKVGDWITPFTTRAHEHGIMLVIKNDEIIKAYKESNAGYDQIDRTKGANLQEVLNDMSSTGRKYYSEHGIEDPMDMYSYSSVLNRYNSETPPLITVNGIKIENHDFIKKLKTNQEKYSFTYWQPDYINIKNFGLDALYGHLEIKTVTNNIPNSDFLKGLSQSLSENGLINNVSKYKLHLTTNQLTVNGKKKSKQLHQKYLAYFKRLMAADYRLQKGDYLKINTKPKFQSVQYQIGAEANTFNNEGSLPDRMMETMRAAEHRVYYFNNEEVLNRLNTELLRDGLISNKKSYQLTINSNELIIDGKKLDRHQEKYENLIRSSAKTKLDEDFELTIRVYGNESDFILGTQELKPAEHIGALSEWGKSMISNEGIDELKDEINSSPNQSQLDVIKNFYQTGIKKFPLIVIDGKTKSMNDLYNLEQKEISSIEMMTSESAINNYGSKAQHGAIVIQSTKQIQIEKGVPSEFQRVLIPIVLNNKKYEYEKDLYPHYSGSKKNTDLYYYIIDYDTDLFEDISVNEQGIVKLSVNNKEQGSTSLDVIFVDKDYEFGSRNPVFMQPIEHNHRTKISNKLKDYIWPHATVEKDLNNNDSGIVSSDLQIINIASKEPHTLKPEKDYIKSFRQFERYHSTSFYKPLKTINKNYPPPAFSLEDLQKQIDHEELFINGMQYTTSSINSINIDELKSITYYAKEIVHNFYPTSLSKNGRVEIELKSNDSWLQYFSNKQDGIASSDLRIIKIASRGINTTKPLIIIDGQVDKRRSLDDLNADDIESVNVLKGEAAHKKYGDKGENGVVEVVSKEGSKVILSDKSSKSISLPIDQNVNPLYVINGAIVQKNEADQLSPDDIKRIDVIKGDAAKKKYGDQGMNGVAEITLKKKE